jgi:murein DD-endopeptidase MepM/ murein hydrolase activator NlpD
MTRFRVAFLFCALFFEQIALGVPDPCITLFCPEVVTECSATGPAVVMYNVTYTNTCGSNVVVTCDQPSGNTFPTGTTWVTCTATNEYGDWAECLFPVVVGDREDPVLTAPARVIHPCTGPDGAEVSFSVSATDDCDTNVTLVCTPPSGSLFPVGTTTVSCTATDGAGNIDRSDFPVIVTGGCGSDPCVSIFVPNDKTLPCTSSNGAVVAFTVTASNTCLQTSLAVTCTPASGSLLPVGVHQIGCSAGIAGGGLSFASFQVEVVDINPPTLNCPTGIVADADNYTGAIVDYSVTGVDDCATSVVIRCSPPSGSTFPVGTNTVYCEGADGHGNSTSCVFTVVVNAPPGLDADHQPTLGLELQWTGEGDIEQTTDLSTPEDRWDPQSGQILSNNNQRSMIVQPSGDGRFFRVAARPLQPPADSDNDGVPDDQDRCPRTPRGLPVDELGCSQLDFIVDPYEIFKPERDLAAQALCQLELDGGSTSTIARLMPALSPDTDPVVPLLERRINDAHLAYSNQVAALREALQEFQAQRTDRLDEIYRNAVPLDAEHADVRPEDLEADRIYLIEEQLTKSLASSSNCLVTLSNLNAATSGPPLTGRFQMASSHINQTGELDDGRLFILPRPPEPPAPGLAAIPVIPPGCEFDTDFWDLAGNVLLGQNTVPTNPNANDFANEIDPRCLQLRIVPAEVGLHLWDSGIRHRPLGYFWGLSFASSKHYLEHGMGLAVIKVSCPYEPVGMYRHWVKILKDADSDGSYGAIADGITESSLPVVLNAANFPEGVNIPVIVREYRAENLGGGGLGPSEIVGEESYVFWLRPWGDYVRANYSKTIFELEDRPTSGEWQSCSVTSLTRVFPLNQVAANTQNFIAGGWTVNGNSTSFPTIKQINKNTLFAVRVKDPNDDQFFAHDGDRGRGLYYPIVRGTQHGLPYQYRVALPTIVRDRIVNCSGTDTYYRIPFDPVLIINTIFGPFWIGGTWNVSQGNNGSFTHNGAQAFAWDFPKPGGTDVVAARGGIVTGIRESSSQSCWNGQACQNCTGAARPNFVNILHQDGTTAQYLHFQNNSVVVFQGQRVYRGDKLADVGTTGCSTSNHLHFHVLNQAGNNTIFSRFQAWDSNQVFRNCYVPPGNSNGWSNNQPPN